MSKSKFAQNLASLTPEQFSRVAADLAAEKAARAAQDWGNIGNLSDNDFEAFTNAAFNGSARSHELAKLQNEAARHGKAVVDPAPAAKPGIDAAIAENEGDDAV